MDSARKRVALLASPYAGNAKVGDRYINGLVCPACGQSEAYAHAAEPNAVICNRRNKCGVVTPLRSICPDLYRNIEREFIPTKKDRHLPATEFLKLRGLEGPVMEGLRYSYFRKTRKGCGGAIMFPVGEKDGKTVWNGRLFDPPPGEGKTHNVGSTSGLIWTHPGLKLDPKLPTYVVEGILDALSLIEMGLQAIAILSSSADPKKLVGQLFDRFHEIILAFDNDPAGHKALRKWKQCLDEAAKERNAAAGRTVVSAGPHIMLPPRRGDWNDFLLSGPLEQVSKEFEAGKPEFRAHARLALANSAQEWADAHYGYFENSSALFLFEFGNSYYSTKVKKGKNKEASAGNEESGAGKDPEMTDEVLPPVRISNFVFKPKYRLLSAPLSSEDVYEHRLGVLRRG